MVNLTIKSYTRSPPLRTASTQPSTILRGWHVHLRIGKELGLGEAFWWPRFGCEPEQIADDLRQSVSMISGASSVSEALSIVQTKTMSSPARYAIELACYDLKARQKSIPLACLLWSKPNQGVLAHRPLRSWTELLSMPTAPVVPIKLKVGLQPPHKELEYLESVLERFPTITLRLDANGSWSLEHAKQMCALVNPEHHVIFEQPLAPESMRELDALQQETPAQIALDESFVLDRTSALGTQCRGVVIKPMYTGGINAALEQAKTSMNLGKFVCVTHALEGRVGRAGAQHLAAGIKGNTAHGIGFEGQSGLLSIAQTMGHGVRH